MPIVEGNDLWAHESQMFTNQHEMQLKGTEKMGCRQKAMSCGCMMIHRQPRMFINLISKLNQTCLKYSSKGLNLKNGLFQVRRLKMD